MSNPRANALLALSDAIAALQVLALRQHAASMPHDGARVVDWPSGHVELLREIYPQFTNRELGLVFGRSDSAVKRKAIEIRCTGKSESTLARQFRVAKKHPNWSGFPKGNVPHTWRPIGTEIVDAYGYLKRKVREGSQPAINNWEFVHLLVWEQHHGPVPEGRNVVFVNGDKTDIRIENLECISNAELGRRNTIHRYPAEIRQMIHAKGVLTRRINSRSKEL